MNTVYESFKTLVNPEGYQFESVNCYQCGQDDCEVFLIGEEDLTGKEGQFQYVNCNNCGLKYHNPRIHLNQIKEFYDSEYIAHRKKTDWGLLTPLYERAMNKHDREKNKLITKYVSLNNDSRVLDVGCAVGTFLTYLKKKHQCFISGVDFKKDLNYPGFEDIDFHCGLFYEQDSLDESSYDLITMWHFLEHCYSPTKSLVKAHTLLNKNGKLIIEVPRLDSLSYKIYGRKWPGIQAPQHTVMFDKKNLISMIENAGYEIEEYLPYGAFPAYFYLFAGLWFKVYGKGLNLDKIMMPYFMGQLMLMPILLFEKKINLAMQTVICRKK